MSFLSILLGELRFSNYILLSSSVLLLYDIIITINQEVACIWRCRFTPVTVVWILNRYAYVVFSFWTCWGALVQQTVTSCVAGRILISVSSIACFFATSLLNAFRVWAIWNRHWLPFTVVFALGLVRPLANLYLDATFRPEQVRMLPAPAVGCQWQIAMSSSMVKRLVLIATVSSIVCDCAVLVATWMKTTQVKKYAGNSEVPQTRLADLLLQHGTFYFGTLIIIGSISLFLLFKMNFNQITSFANVLTSILTSRFILHIRSLDNNDLTHIPYSESTSRTIRFSTNLGALEASFVDSQEYIRDLQSLIPQTTIGLESHPHDFQVSNTSSAASTLESANRDLETGDVMMYNAPNLAIAIPSHKLEGLQVFLGRNSPS